MRGGLDLATVLLGAVALETIFRCFHSHSHSLDLFMHGGFEFI